MIILIVEYLVIFSIITLYWQGSVAPLPHSARGPWNATIISICNGISDGVIISEVTMGDDCLNGSLA